MKKLLVLAMIMAIPLFLAGNAHATLLGIHLGVPDIFSDSTGTYSYNYATQEMLFTAHALTITFDNVNIIPITGGTYSANFKVDNAGNFVSGVSGDDLTISGNFTYNSTPYSGTLLRGEITDFGWQPGTYALFDYYVDVKGGALASYFGSTAGDIASAENHNFTGNWQVSHSGTKVKHDTAGLVPEPASIALLGMGILGLFGIGRKKIKA